MPITIIRNPMHPCPRLEGGIDQYCEEDLNEPPLIEVEVGDVAVAGDGDVEVGKVCPRGLIHQLEVGRVL